MKDPHAKTGGQVSVSGRFVERWKDEQNRWCYLVATGSGESDQVIVRAPRYKGEIEFIKGEKMDVYGVDAEPLEEKTETGLTVYKLQIDAEMINLVCYNTKVYEVEMFDAEKANKVEKKKK